MIVFVYARPSVIGPILVGFLNRFFSANIRK